MDVKQWICYFLSMANLTMFVIQLTQVNECNASYCIKKQTWWEYKSNMIKTLSHLCKFRSYELDWKPQIKNVWFRSFSDLSKTVHMPLFCRHGALCLCQAFSDISFTHRDIIKTKSISKYDTFSQTKILRGI